MKLNKYNTEPVITFFDRSVSWDHDTWIRHGILIFSFVILFVFIHNAEPQLYEIELGSISTKNIVAQTDFVCLDEEASWIAKRNVIYNIDSVLKIFSPKRVLDDVSEKLAQLFSVIDVKLGLCFARGILNKIVDLNFSSARNVSFINKYGLSDKEFYVVHPSVNQGSKISLPSSFIADVTRDALSHAKSEITLSVVDVFKNYNWFLEENVSLGNRIKEVVNREISDRYMLVSSGSLILEIGTRVSDKHIAMIKAMHKAIIAQKKLWSFKSIFSTFSVVAAIVMSAFMWFNSIWEFKNSNRHVLLVFSMVFIYLFASIGIHNAIVDLLFGTFTSLVSTPLFSPIIAFLSASIYPSKIASPISLCATIVLAICLPVNAVKFIIINLVALLVLLSESGQLLKRHNLVFVVLKVWICVSLALLGLNFLPRTEFNYAIFAEQLFFSLFFILLSIVSVLVILPLLETSFSIMSEHTLAEFLNPSNPLLTRLAIDAPGTYNHSLMVAHLSECAAIAIGANAIFCRVASLYHDIGKLVSPRHFGENQNSVNVHNVIPPEYSARIILSHVDEGVNIAKKHGLPEDLIRIIEEHHGMSLIHYFYRKACMQYGDHCVNQEDFRYKGPKPKSKEAVIIMLADCIEAASRSLDSVDEKSVTLLLNGIVRILISDGQLSDSVISFSELKIVQKVLSRTLVSSMHVRTKYPKRHS